VGDALVEPADERRRVQLQVLPDGPDGDARLDQLDDVSPIPDSPAT
jgi:hypothetical protein